MTNKKDDLKEISEEIKQKTEELTQAQSTESTTEPVSQKVVAKKSGPSFDYKSYLIKVGGGKTYFPASTRIKWVREEHPTWSFRTQLIDLTDVAAIVKAEVYDESNWLLASAYKRVTKKGKGNQDDAEYLTKAETGAVSRALSFCGYALPDDDDLADDSDRYADDPQPKYHAPKQTTIGGW